MTTYIEIIANQRPFSVGLDGNGRTVISCNFRARVAGDVQTLEEDIGAIITSLVGGTPNVNLFFGPQANIPPGDGPYTMVVDTGGREVIETQQSDRYERPTVQILVHAKSSSVARTRALAIYDALDGKRNVSI